MDHLHYPIGNPLSFIGILKVESLVADGFPCPVAGVLTPQSEPQGEHPHITVPDPP
jgi:hypothetical protein